MLFGHLRLTDVAVEFRRVLALNLIIKKLSECLAAAARLSWWSGTGIPIFELGISDEHAK